MHKPQVFLRSFKVGKHTKEQNDNMKSGGMWACGVYTHGHVCEVVTTQKERKVHPQGALGSL